MDSVQTADRWLDRFFDHYYRVNPVSATFIGVHEHDSELPRPASSLSGNTDMVVAALLDDLDAEWVASADDTFRQVDLLLARSYVRTNQVERQSGHLSNNPCVYTGEAIFGVVSLFLRDFAPLGQRLTHAANRLRQVPRLLQDGASAVQIAPEGWVERAIRECDGAELLLRDGLPILLSRDDAANPEIVAAQGEALAAFADYRRQLAERAVAIQPATYAVGQERFDWLLREAHFLDMTGDQIARYARGELDLARSALNSALAEQGFADWQPVAEKLAAEHPSPAGYIGRFQTVWDAARRHAVDRDLLTWPDFPIVFEPIPEWARSAQPYLYFLFYRCPPPFDDGQTQRYLVTPIDHLPTEQQVRVLRAVNDAQITMNHVIHHAGIGHHVQNWHAARARSRIGRMAGNDCALRIAMASAGTFVEGWACYATDLMQESGFLAPVQQLSLLHSRMRMAARAVVDVELHNGTFSLEDATAFYAGEVDMTPEASRAEAIKNSMFPTMAMMYLIGTDLIHDLRADMQQRWGAEFSLRRFHDEFLSWGAIPVTLVARLMRGEPLEAGSFSPGHRGGVGQAASRSGN